MMKLEDFVKETIEQLIRGVKAADTSFSDDGGTIVPGEFNPRMSEGIIGHLRYQPERPVFSVEFDVAVTAFDSSSSEGGAGIFVAPFGLGAKTKEETQSSFVSRVRFVVPITYRSNRK